MANQFFEDIRYKIKNGNPVTRLILINVAVFLILGIIRILSFSSGESTPLHSLEDFINRNLSLPLSWSGFFSKPWTIFTYMFTQAGISHIIWNMIILYWFGEILTQFSNSRKIIPLYLMAGVVAGLFAIFLISVLPVFKIYIGSTMIGASGAVTAIIVAAATLVPNHQTSLPFIGPVKLLYVALFVIFINILDVASYSNVGGNLAHLGGALMGYIFIWQYKKGNDLARPVNQFSDWSEKTFLRKSSSTLKVVHKRKLSNEEYNYNKVQTEKMVDAILDKISKSGYESLTKNEREILFKASKK